MTPGWKFFGSYQGPELSAQELNLLLYRGSTGARGFKVQKNGKELCNAVLELNGGALVDWADELLRRTVQVEDAAAVMKTSASKEFLKLFGDSAPNESSSHFEVAQWLSQTHQFITLRQANELVMYDDAVCVYQRGAELDAKSMAEKIKGSKSTSAFRNEVLGHLLHRNLKRVEDFDSDPRRIHLADCILNLETLDLEPETPDFLSFVKVNMRYDKEATCPAIISFIDEAHDSAVDKLHDIDFIAACLYPKAIKKSKLDWGDTDSGKTTYQKLIEKALGPENVCHISPQELENDRFIAFNIVGKWAQLHGDVDKKSLDKSTRFKTTTGGDTISVQRKNGQPFDYAPRAKGIFAANQIPLTKDESDAFFNRWVPIHWPFVFRPDGKYTKDDAGKLVKVNDTRRDPEVIDKMTTEAELSGLLNLCIRRLPSIIAIRSIPYAPSIEEVRRIWLVNSDQTRQFLFEAAGKDPDGELERAALYMLYHAWCAQKGVTPDTQRTFNNRVEWITGAKKLDTTRTELGESVNRQLWKGLRLQKKNLTNAPVPPVETGTTGGSPDSETEWDEIKAAFGRNRDA